MEKIFSIDPPNTNNAICHDLLILKNKFHFLDTSASFIQSRPNVYFKKCFSIVK